MNTSRMIASAGPHIHGGNSIPRMMRNLAIGLCPVALVGVYLYGMQAVWLLTVTISSAVFWEAAIQKLFGKRISVGDFSAVAGGLMLALLLPPSLPWWMVVLGTFMMIFLGKEIYGGLGSSPFNGVLIAWAVLKISYPMAMADWPLPDRVLYSDLPPLDVLRYDGLFMIQEYYPLKTLFLGLDVVGPIGESSKLALLAGGIWLLATRTITWHIPAAMIAGLLSFSGIIWLANPQEYAPPLFHLLAGGALMAAFFLAVDFSSSPVTKPGMLAFGFFAGVMAVTLRTWSQWTEGVYFAVFLASLLTPLMDKIRPSPFGKKKLFTITFRTPMR